MKQSIGLILKITFTDYASFVSLLLSTITVFFGPLWVVFAIICIPFYVKRIKLIQDVLQNGEEVMGLVVSKKLQRAEWLLKYTYSYNGQDYKTSNYVVGFKVPVEKGSAVTIMVKKDKPDVAFIKELYLSVK